MGQSSSSLNNLHICPRMKELKKEVQSYESKRNNYNLRLCKPMIQNTQDYIKKIIQQINIHLSLLKDEIIQIQKCSCQLK